MLQQPAFRTGRTAGGEDSEESGRELPTPLERSAQARSAGRDQSLAGAASSMSVKVRQRLDVVSHRELLDVAESGVVPICMQSAELIHARCS